VGARTDAARAEVLASRASLVDEINRLEASGRAAVDIPAKIRREPAKTAGVAAGAAFLLLGGPTRLVRRVRRAVGGPDADLPKSMLPDEIEKTLRHLGHDGDRVRGTLEREFRSYLESRGRNLRDRDLAGTLSVLAGNLLNPVTRRAGRQLAERLFEPDNAAFDEAIRRVRARREGGKGTDPGAGSAGH
jgi:hypothetical protein